MRSLLNSTAVILVLAGTALTLTGPANADSRYDRGGDRGAFSVSLDFGNIAYAYRDGYWDNDHRWHHWRNSRDYRHYRNANRDNFHNWSHNRYGSNGWMMMGPSNVAFAYRDGYWDGDHSWHRWNSDREYQDYRDRNRTSYHDWNHDRDSNNGWIVAGPSNISFGYRDGYMDDNQRFHAWNNYGDYQSYRNDHNSTYRDWNHDRDGGGGLSSIGFGNVALAYRDGYWDNDHNWHNWNNDRDFQTYRDHSGSNFHDWNRDRDNSNGWQR